MMYDADLFFRDFLHWYTPQIQYKNPNVQLVALKDMMPSPFIRLFLGKFQTDLHDTFSDSADSSLSFSVKIHVLPFSDGSDLF